MALTIVTLTDRPDLIETTARWRWEAFFRNSDLSLCEIRRREIECGQSPEFIPTVFVLLKEDVPVGMIAICMDDLEARPELNPWLAGLYVHPDHRKQGYAQKLIAHLEGEARGKGIQQLSLYSADAALLYCKLGWRELERFVQEEKTFIIMRKHLFS